MPFDGGLPIGLIHPDIISDFRISESSWPESLLDLLPQDLLALGIGSDSFLLLAIEGGGTTVGLGRLHQTRRSPAVSKVEQSEEMETSVTQLE